MKTFKKKHVMLVVAIELAIMFMSASVQADTQVRAEAAISHQGGAEVSALNTHALDNRISDNSALVNKALNVNALNKKVMVLGESNSNSYVLNVLKKHYGNASVIEAQNDKTDGIQVNSTDNVINDNEINSAKSKDDNNHSAAQEEQGNGIKQAATTIEKQVQASDIVYANLGDTSVAKSVLNTYVAEAIKQQKVLVFDHMDGQSLAAFPLSFNSEVVIVKPQTGQPDLIVTFNQQREDGEQPGIMKITTGTSTYDNVHGYETVGPTTTRYEKNDNVLPNSFDDMLDYQRAEVLTSITNTLDDVFTGASVGSTPPLMASKGLSSKGVASAGLTSGGSIGYPCPIEAKNEHLCYSALTVNRSPIILNSGDLKLNTVTGYTIGAYRTDIGTSLFISPFGSINPTMTHDVNDHRGYFIEDATVHITVDPGEAAGLVLYKRMPENQNGNTEVTSTSGMNYSVTGTVDEKGPSLGGGINYSSSRSETEDVSDFKITTTSDTGYDAAWDYQQNLHTTAHDWYTHDFMKYSVIKPIPDIAAKGLQYATEAIWISEPGVAQGKFQFTVWGEVTSKDLYLDPNTPFVSNLVWPTMIQGTGSFLGSFNTDWLKKL